MDINKKDKSTDKKVNISKLIKKELKLKEIPFLEELYTMRVESGKDRECVDRKSSLMADKYKEFLENKIEDKALLAEFLERFEAYENRIDEEIQLISIADYGIGLVDAKILNKELNVIKNIKGIKPTEDVLEKIYTMALEKVGQLTEEDRKFLDEKLKKIDFSDILDTLDVEKKKAFNTMIEERFNNIYSEMGYFCQKYWKNGFGYGHDLVLICSRL